MGLTVCILRNFLLFEMFILINGQGSQYVCHCKDGDSCNVTSFECSGECAQGWMGPGCQYVNLAQDERATVSGSHKVRFTDGTDNTCEYTEYGIRHLVNIVLSRASWIDWLQVVIPENSKEYVREVSATLKLNLNTLVCSSNYSQGRKGPAYNIICDRAIYASEVDITFDLHRRAYIRICEVRLGGGMNVAVNKLATQQNDLFYKDRFYLARLAVDGNTDRDFLRSKSCSHTGECGSRSSTYWQVDLGDLYKLNTVRIYNRQGFESRLQGFSLWTKGESETWTVQYTDRSSSSGPGTIINLTTSSNLLVRYLRITLQPCGSLSLCEVQVFSPTSFCETTKYGFNCSESCNCKNTTENCEKIFGYCASGCATGYTGRECKEICQDGYYGDGCVDTCDNCIDTKCDPVFGGCTLGCKPGWLPGNNSLCDVSCPDEFYGTNCTEQCSENCQTQEFSTRTCNITTGTCHYSCKPGWRTLTCTEKCDSGRYGPRCSQRCSVDCENSLCHHVNGTCLNCRAGRYGDRCQIICEEGTFGPNCRYNCSQGCKQGRCYAVSGRCRNGCTPGWKGNNCTSECDPGFYGDGCTSPCSDNCADKLCHNVEGTCYGCIAGYMGSKCSQDCPSGQYGQDCNQTCGEGCEEGQCNRTDGLCTCGPGWEGQLCDSECGSGFYGAYCQLECSSNCRDEMCSGIHGGCLSCPSGMRGTMCTESEGMSTAGISGIAVACILILAIAVVIAVIIIRRRPDSEKSDDLSVQYQNTPDTGSKKINITKKDIMHKETSHSSLIPISQNNEVNNGDVGDVYYNLAATSTSSTVVAIKDFPQYVRKMRSNKKQLYEEFQRLPKDLVHDCKIANSPENAKKNRYKNICAYDHSRVILEVDTPYVGDYINACYIDTPRKEKTFIAAQGPNDIIIDDFVRMLWQLNIQKVVMLTNLFEEGKQKCHQYWPEKGDKLFGDITVTLQDTKRLADYTVRKLSLTKGDSKPRHVTQFHYTAWPDKGVPTSGASLIDFRDKVIPSGAPNKSPIVVHCSAGIGRTGTFIALQFLKEELEMSSSQDIFTCVWRLRQQRVNMVQTKDQYVFLHETSLLSLIVSRKTFSTGQFPQEYSKLHMTNLQEEFKIVDEFPVRVDEEEFSVATKQSEKNRSSTILAGNSFRPILTPNTDYEETLGTYINAVCLPSYEDARRFIQTQSPLPNTIVDMLRLIADHNVRVIVMLDNYSQDDGDAAVYWPEVSSPLLVGPYRVECLSVSENDNVIIRNLQLKEADSTQKICHLTAKFWPKDGLPCIASLLQLVRMSQNTTDHTPIIAHCRSGVERSGLFCAVSAVIDRINHDHTVAVPFVVSNIKTIRRQNIQNVNTYKFCYDAAAEYLNTEMVYENTEADKCAGPDVMDTGGNVYASIQEEPIYSNQ